MTTSLPTIVITRKFVFLVAIMALVLAFLVSASPVGAVHCYVANKPPGAGAVGFDDIKQAGNSDKVIAPGAFISGSEIGVEQDLFIRGGGDPGFDTGIQGFGSLPDQPHHNGDDENGIQSLD